MDLEFRSYARHADEFISLYLERTPDTTFTAMMPFYRAYRACVRAKVECLQAREQEVPAQQRVAASVRAGRYWEFAERIAATVTAQTLVVVVGLSGSGKSFLARPLAARIGAVLLSSDVVRRDSTPAQDHEEQPYSEAARDATYGKMFAAAEEYLSSGLSVVLDATFVERRHRASALQLARESIPTIIIEVATPPNIVRDRMRARDAAGSISDARWDVYLKQQAAFEPVVERPAQTFQINGAQPVDVAIERTAEAIRHMHRDTQG